MNKRPTKKRRSAGRIPFALARARRFSEPGPRLFRGLGTPIDLPKTPPPLDRPPSSLAHLRFRGAHDPSGFVSPAFRTQT